MTHMPRTGPTPHVANCTRPGTPKIGVDDFDPGSWASANMFTQRCDDTGNERDL